MPKVNLNAQLKALSTISSAITSDKLLDDILKLIVVVTAEIMNSNICSLMLLDTKTNLLTIKATQSISDEYIKKPPLKLGEGIVGKVAHLNKPIIVKDIALEKNYKYREIAIKEGLKSLLCVPLSVKNKIIGVLNCYTSVPHDFTKNETNLLMTIANQAAIAIENTQLLSRSNIIQEELETYKRLSRAKGILMRDYSLSEEDAYLKIQKYSMNNRKSIREIADNIIQVDDIKKQII